MLVHVSMLVHIYFNTRCRIKKEGRSIHDCSEESTCIASYPMLHSHTLLVHDLWLVYPLSSAYPLKVLSCPMAILLDSNIVL
jgi:hypothetical protein